MADLPVAALWSTWSHMAKSSALSRKGWGEADPAGRGLSEPKARRFWVSRGEGALRKPPWKNLDTKQCGALDLGLAKVPVECRGRLGESLSHLAADELGDLSPDERNGHLDVHGLDDPATLRHLLHTQGA